MYFIAISCHYNICCSFPTGQHNPDGNDVVRTPSLPTSAHSTSPERLYRTTSQYYRRRSSLSVDDAHMFGNMYHHDTSTGPSSSEASPINRRRSSATFLDPADKEYLSRIHRQRSISPVMSNYSTSPPSTCSCNSPSHETGPFVADLGELKFSVQVSLITKMFLNCMHSINNIQVL